MVCTVSKTILDLSACHTFSQTRGSPLLLPLTRDMRRYQITLGFGHVSLPATVKNNAVLDETRTNGMSYSSEKYLN